MSAEKQARKDAREYVRAQMFYGEGAGTRRKLISAKVEGNAAKSEAYARAFHQELSRQDLAEHAAKARRERELKDKSRSVSKNVRGLATGNYQSVSSGVLVIAGVAYVMHQTGLDRVVYAKGKELYADVSERISTFRARRKLKKSGIHVVTDLPLQK